MSNEFVQMIVTALASSGLIGLIITNFVKQQIEKQNKNRDRQETLYEDNMFLMMARLDCLADMTHLMAKKLHDSGVINGDLEDLNNKYKKIEDEYDKNIKHLALEVLNK